MHAKIVSTRGITALSATLFVSITLTMFGCSGGAESATQEAELMSSTQTVTATASVFIDAGGPGAAPFVADQAFVGGRVIDHANPIDVSGVTNPAPAAVYQTARTGSFSYTLGGFAPGVFRTLRLHFAETYHSAAGQRLFNVAVNGATVLSNFDVFAAAGGKNKAYVAELTEPADASGAFTIAFKTVQDAGLVSGIEVPAVQAPTGSLGCGLAPSTDVPTRFVAHDVNVSGVNAIYLPGGTLADQSGPYNFGHRVYSVKLPTNYDPNKPYAVAIGAGGCGGDSVGFAAVPNGGFQVSPSPSSDTIQVGLMYLNGCFVDGGPSISNRNDTPELSYLKSVLADVSAHLCVDSKRVLLSGYSSGAFTGLTLGCGAADLVRGIATLDGGLRAARPACTGPEAAFLVAGTLDTEDPVGPLAVSDPAYARLGGPGLAPARDDLLKRNGCVGTATAPWDAAYPDCVKYTGCPTASPVVWCPVPTGHGASTDNGVNYSGAAMWKFLSSLPPR